MLQFLPWRLVRSCGSARDISLYVKAQKLVPSQSTRSSILWQQGWTCYLSSVQVKLIHEKTSGHCSSPSSPYWWWSSLLYQVWTERGMGQRRRAGSCLDPTLIANFDGGHPNHPPAHACRSKHLHFLFTEPLWQGYFHGPWHVGQWGFSNQSWLLFYQPQKLSLPSVWPCLSLLSAWLTSAWSPWDCLSQIVHPWILIVYPSCFLFTCLIYFQCQQ